jgi:hypothetical protein
MKRPSREIEFAIEVFVRGHAAGRSRTFPYEVSRVAPLWAMRDAPRKNPRDYRKEEWIAHDVDPRKVDAIVRQHARGRFFLCVMLAEGEPDANASRLQGSRISAARDRRFFVQRLKRIQGRNLPFRSNACAHPTWRRSWGRSLVLGQLQTICSVMTLRSASTWRSMEWTSLGACAA